MYTQCDNSEILLVHFSHTWRNSAVLDQLTDVIVLQLDDPSGDVSPLLANF